MRVLVLLALTTAFAALGCGDSGLGRKCINPDAPAPVKGTGVVNPALECPSRLCLLQGDLNSGDLLRSTCTVECVTDSDCQSATLAVAGNAADGQLCPKDKGFVCAVVSTVGKFKCKKMCTCKADLRCGENADSMGNPITPKACDPQAPTPTCT